MALKYWKISFNLLRNAQLFIQEVVWPVMIHSLLNSILISLATGQLQILNFLNTLVAFFLTSGPEVIQTHCDPDIWAMDLSYLMHVSTGKLF